MRVCACLCMCVFGPVDLPCQSNDTSSAARVANTTFYLLLNGLCDGHGAYVTPENNLNDTHMTGFFPTQEIISALNCSNI